jgi:hypothetical protein
MKKIMKFWGGAMLVVAMPAACTFAQKIDQERMTRDIEVAENVLGTLIKQEVSPQKTFFGMDIKGYYQEGYGVTFRLPSDYSRPAIYSDNMSFIYSDEAFPRVAVTPSPEPRENIKVETTDGFHLKKMLLEKRRMTADSARDEYNKKLIKASQNFILDYGDFMTQLSPNERIVVTNKGENKSWFFKDNKRTHISIEALKSDVSDYKQGKITRDQALAKLKIINTEYLDVKEADLELFASIFSRLYLADLSKTYFSDNQVYYDRLKDYGVIFYMQVFSSSPIGYKRMSMPTLGLDDIDEETRNKKVTELYPIFEKDLKDNILEYGRTLKTLGEEEVLVFNTTLTQCSGCGIPSTLELTIKASVLKEYGLGKIDKNAAMNKFTIKKGPSQ